jgi:hypothetical protein
MNGDISTSENWRGSLSKVFGYGLKEQAVIRSCQGFPLGEKWL